MKKYKSIIYIGICILCLLTSNCVDEYNAKLPDGNIGVLVVDGNIISDSTVVFTLNRSFSLNEEGLPDDYNRIDADVKVVGTDGTTYTGLSLGSGRFLIPIGTLNREAKYSLEIQFEGDTYTSEPQNPLVTEPIDSLSFQQPDEEGSVYITLSTHSDDAAHYIWTYVDTWELRSSYMTQWFYNPSTGKIDTYEDYMYWRGWATGSSTDIYVGSTEGNRNNALVDKRIYSIANNNLRLSTLYSPQITQRRISKGEYEYYQNKLKLSEDMGGLFTPQPSEMPTNITCSDPSKRVIGYVGVNMNVTQCRTFVHRSMIHYVSSLRCGVEEPDGRTPDEMYEAGFRISFYDAMANTVEWAPRVCTDVRALGATMLTAPDYWPTK